MFVINIAPPDTIREIFLEELVPENAKEKVSFDKKIRIRANWLRLKKNKSIVYQSLFLDCSMYDKLIKPLEYILCDYSNDDKDYCCGDVADGNIITTLQR